MKKKVYLVALLLISCFTLFGFGLKANADELSVEYNDRIVVIKNQQYVNFENEFLKLMKSGELGYKDGIYKLNGIGESTNLIKKYEGAEITLVSSTASYSTKFVNGGVNSFASTRAGMERLRTDLSYTATLLMANGTVGGALVAGPLGALVGLIGTGMLGDIVRDASNTMQSWINVGSTKGGVRITLTEQFAISNIDSQSQAMIRKL